MVGQTTAHTVTLNGSEVLDGTVHVNNVQVVRIDGGGGNDDNVDEINTLAETVVVRPDPESVST